MDANGLTDFKSEEEELCLEWLCKPEPIELHSEKEITQMVGETFDCSTHQNSIFFGLHYDPIVVDLIPCQLPPLPKLNLECQDFDDFGWFFGQYFPSNHDSSSMSNVPSPSPTAPEAQPPPFQHLISDCNGNHSIGDFFSEIFCKTHRESVGSSSSTRTTADQDRKRKRSRRSKSIEIELDEIKRHFNLPITKAAREMKVGLTMLKKRCRELNIHRWPHRKIKSLASLIENVKESGMTKELEKLENHRRLMEKLPEVELTEETKKLRQACFKAKYKSRRSLATVLV